MNDDVSRPVQLALATNADSLATWLLPALKEVMTQRTSGTQSGHLWWSRSIEKLKSGEVAGQSVWNLNSQLLGVEPII